MSLSRPYSLLVVTCLLPWMLLCAVRNKSPPSLPTPPPQPPLKPPLNRGSSPGVHGAPPTQLHLAVAFAAQHEAVVTRAVNRTLAALYPELTAARVTLATLYHPLPSGFSPPLLGELAVAWARPRVVVAVLIFAPETQGMTPALAAAAADIPVLWATSEVNHGYLERETLGPLEVRLDAGILDLFRGLRSLMLATHWHTFTILYTGLPLRRDVADVITTPPLQPRFIPIRPDAARQAIFRLLSDVSHLTKGVVVVMSDGAAAKRVMDEAKTLHMVQGNFVWLWIDTGASLTSRNESKLSIFYPFPGDDRVKDRRARESGDHQGYERSSSNGDYFSNIIKYLMGESVTTNSTESNSSASESDTNIDVLVSRETSVNITQINKTATPLHETGYGFTDSKNSSNTQNYTNEINKLDFKSTEESVSNKVINKLDRSRSKSSLRLSKNTSVTNDYVWISNRRGISVFPKDKVSRLVEHLPFPLHVFENSNASDSLDSLYSGNNESDRLSGPRATRSVKVGDVTAADVVPPLPVGVLGIRALPLRFDRHLVRSAVRLFVEALRRALHRKCHDSQEPACRNTTREWQKNFSHYLVRELKTDPEQVNASSDKIDRVLAPRFQILNLVPDSPQIVLEDFEMQVVQESTTWRPVGDMVGQHVHLDTVVWPGGDLVPVSTSRGVRSVFRVVTSLAPPFVMEGELDEDGQCLRGLECHRLLTSDKDNLTLVFNEMERLEDAEDEAELPERDIWAMGSIFQNSSFVFVTGGLEGVERRLREEYERDLAAAERAHEAAVEAARNRSRDEVERLRTQHEQLIEAEAQLRAGHQRELQAAEERTKQVTLEFCAAQIRRLEERYVEEASRRADPGVVAALRTALHERSGEVEKLKQMLAGLEEGHQKQLAALQLQMNSDRDKAAQMMVQWAQELKDTQGELKLKEAIVDEQRSQIEKARAKVQKLRNQLITTNEKMETEYTSKCNQYKAEFIKIVEEQEKTVKEKMKQLEEAYHKQVKELKKEMRKKKHST